MNEKLLESQGLNTKEIMLFKAILTTKGLSPAELAKAVGIKRTTAYGMARGLVEKGLLVEDSTRRPRVFAVAAPKEIEALILIERNRMESKSENLKALANELSQLVTSETYPVPQIKFIDEEKIDQFMREATPKWLESILAGDLTWWGFQDHTFVENYANYIDWFWKHATEKLELKLLSNRSGTEAGLKGKYPNRHIKFWGEATSFISTTWIMGDYVVMINTRQKPFYLVQIHSALLAHDQREVFKNLWPLV